MTTPFFSVVMPTYNQADFLKKSIPSVLSQTWESLELIIVNNFSDDDTVEVVSTFKDTRVSLINFRNNGVIGASRNVGIKGAIGKYIAFLDSDDSWHPEKLERVHSVLMENPETDLICHNENLIMEDKVATKVLEYGPNGNSLFEHLLWQGSCLSTSATTVRKDKLLEVNMFSEKPDIVAAEDYDLWLKLSKVCRYRFIPDVLGNFVVHKNSTSSNIERHTMSILRVVESHIPNDIRNTEINRLLKKRKGRIFYGAGRRVQQRRLFSKSLEWYMKSIMQDPTNPKAYVGALTTLLRIGI